MKKIIVLMLILVLVGVVFSQSVKFVPVQQHNRIKDALITMTLRWEDSEDLNRRLVKTIENLKNELRPIKNDSLKTVLKKYGLE